MNVTIGTVTAVVTVEPLAVCVIVMVVTGIATGAVGWRSGLGPRPFPFVAVPVTVAVLICVTVLGVGATGTRVMLLGTPVQIPGFCGTKSAQIPAR